MAGLCRKRNAHGFPAWLENVDSALEWAWENVETSYEKKREFFNDMTDAVSNYVDAARDILREGKVTLYRAVRVGTGRGLDGVDLACLGKAWSLRPEGAQVLGMAPRASSKTRDVVLTGVARSEDVDWAYGFESFISYGEDQFEISLNKDSPVVIVEVGGVALSRPAMGSTGPAGEVWEATCGKRAQRGFVGKPNPPPTELIRGSHFFHGTTSQEAAEAIARDGLRGYVHSAGSKYAKGPSKRRGAMTPQEGAAYITPELEYALIYAGLHPTIGPPRETPYGYILVFRGEDLWDVDPDEDSVGEAITAVLRGSANTVLGEKVLQDASLVAALRGVAGTLTPPLLRRLRDGDYPAQATAGKKVTSRLRERDRLRLIELGAHVAHRGPLKPVAVWRAKGSMVPGEFFSKAERVRNHD